MNLKVHILLFLTLASPIDIPLEKMASASTAEEPLLLNQPGEEEEDEDEDVSVLLEKNLRKPGLFVWLLTFSAGISGLLFGCMFFSVYSPKSLAFYSRRALSKMIVVDMLTYTNQTTQV